MDATKTEAASKPAWILLRGLARSQSHWGDFPDCFRRRFPESEIEFLDLAGNGTEAERPSFTSIAENIADLRSRSRLLRAGRPVSLLTISMGSMLGASWAEAHPPEIRRLVMINTSDRRESFFFERLRPGTYLPFLSMILAPNPLSRERKVLKLTTQLLSVEQQEKIALRHSRLRQTGLGNFLRQLRAAQSFRFPLQAVPAPTLILTGARDCLANPICSQRLADRWQVPLRIHPEAGHDLPLEVPDWICDQIQEWLASSPENVRL